MRTGISLSVTFADRARLRALVKDRNASQKHVWRARIVLLTAEGVGTSAIMRDTGKSKTCVWRWPPPRRRCCCCYGLIIICCCCHYATPRLLPAPLLRSSPRCQQARTRPSPRDYMERRRCLADRLAVPTGGLLPHRLDHSSTRRERRLQRLRHVCAVTKAALSSGCASSHSGNRSSRKLNRSRHGGNKMAEAFGVTGHI